MRTPHAGVSAVAFLLAAIPAFAQTRPSAAQLARLAAMANGKDLEGLQRITAAGVLNDYSWVTHGLNMVDRPRAWQVKLLELPDVEGASGEYVAFTRYHPCESTSDHLYRIDPGPDGPRLRTEMPETDIAGWRVRAHQAEIRFDVANRTVRIHDKATVERRDGALADALLRINAIYTVDAVKVNGAPAAFRQAGGFIAIHPADAPSAQYELTYHAKLGDGPEDYMRPDQAALTSYWYPHTGRLPATIDVSITVPRGWSAIGQGEPSGKTTTEAETTFRWQNTLPVCYLTVAAGKFSVTTRKVDGVAVSAYLIHPNPQHAQQAIDTAGNAISWFSKNFSPFPFTRYAVVESDLFPAALECYSFTLCGRSYIPMAVVHEVSHTWWGGVVPNTYTRTLWNESFAEYSDGLYGRLTKRAGMHEFNTQMFAQMLPMIQGATLASAHDSMEMTGSLVGYGKGSLVLENLERMLTTPKMLACIQRFVKDHKSGDDAEWKNFIQAVCEVAGPEWAGYFPAWLERSDVPDLRLAGVAARPLSVEVAGGQGWVVTGNIAQANTAYWVHVPVVVQTASGSVRREIDATQSQQPFRIETQTKPSQVELDPRREALRSAPTRSAGAPNLMTLQTSATPLLVLYATGGSPEETAVAKSVATNQVKVAFPFAAITVKADSAASEQDLAGSNVLLLGRPESLRVPAQFKAALPYTFKPGQIIETSAGGARYGGASNWALTIQRHPARRDGILAHAAGASPDALAGFKNQGNLPLTDSRFVANEKGKLIAASRGAADDGTVVKLKL